MTAGHENMLRDILLFMFTCTSTKSMSQALQDIPSFIEKKYQAAY